ncbi:MAG: radical SAM protein [Treponema sp.]|jgi:pyruvate formate lyase activating enzyme|nr:radical SAM protein [Treponema sp.]
MTAAGLLFNIQKFSLHDGPGIRTVVFFKGCPLSCRWCSNPESQRAEPCLFWEEDASAPGGVRAKPDSREYPLEEVLEICLQDRPFYEESGGGVTLSGGEPLTQRAFAAALLKSLGEENIHTAIETTGYAPPEVFKEVTDRADLLLFDLKHHDDRRHFEGTGVHHGPILANLKSALDNTRAADRDRPAMSILPRIPVIPGYNNALEDARGFAGLLNSLGLKRAQLLPFHQFGEKKYAMLRIPYPMKGLPQLHPEDLEEYRRAFIAEGIDCFF